MCRNCYVFPLPTIRRSPNCPIYIGKDLFLLKNKEKIRLEKVTEVVEPLDIILFRFQMFIKFLKIIFVQAAQIFQHIATDPK